MREFAAHEYLLLNRLRFAAAAYRKISKNRYRITFVMGGHYWRGG
jgi:hypothetical protein